MPDVIYTVTTIRLPAKGRSCRTVGWFQDLETAITCVRENWGDIREYEYNYAVIERVSPGLYSTEDRDERWFEWKDDSYQESEKPECFTGVVDFSMG